jgi:cytochrome c-type biogenesis protein CcmH|tara:strand:- start:7217 stop:7633 length:417 start_codon:yes stop_codon:yes gene_type:complete
LKTSYYKDKKFTVIKLSLLSCLIFAISCGFQETDEEIAQRIDRTLMCPVCPAETLDQSQSELAKQMKSVIRSQLSEGKTDQEIIDYFVQRYGEEVLSSPPKSGSTLIAWITPVVILILITLVISIRLIKKSIVTKNEI